MSDLGLSTIAQLLFQNEQSIDFARIVAEVEAVVTRSQGHEAQINWDCDDYVCFDIPGTRIQLAWSDVNRRGYGGCLSVSVGPGMRPSTRAHDEMCSRLTDRICSRYDPVAVLWCQVEGAVGAEAIDTLLETLPNLGGALPSVESLVAALTAQEAMLSAEKRAAPALPMVAANDVPNLPPLQNTELERVRSALYASADQDGAPYSTQMRLAVHCMNATLIVVWLPLGAALMTYSILKGENMRLSSRVMALAGTAFALAHSPVGAAVAAMARTMS